MQPCVLKFSLRSLAVAAALAAAWPAGAQQSSVGALEARTSRAAAGQALAVAGASRAEAVRSALQARGTEAQAAAAVVEVGSGAGRGGHQHVRLEQQVGGLSVYGSEVKATFNARGELVHMTDRLAPVAAGRTRGAAIGELAALKAAMARVHPAEAASFQAGARQGNTQRFAGSRFFHEDPQVTRVLLPQADGLAEAFLVQTWTQKTNQLHHVLVDGAGMVLKVENRTANDSYAVFPVDPGKGPQVVKAGPGTGNAQSPAGWLSGTQTTINIKGNNVSAYLDANANNSPDTGGTSVTTGNFTTAASLTTQPSTTGNKAVAVQNLFYLNNVIHDILYTHGFNEAAGNFQTNNFGKGGAGNDPVNAEAQDGGGTDNANFATPADGSRPRMQMYLWTGPGATHEVLVSPGAALYGAMAASFATSLTTTGVSGAVVAATPADGCTAIGAAVSGKLALINRGTCDFVTKVRNAQSAGAKGVIVANNVGGTDIFAMGGTSTTRIRIPAVMISQNDGAALRATAGASATLRLKAVQPLMMDGDLDSDIVYHEYGHGLTWRMIGGMSGPLAGAIGEGASDVVAFMVNGDDVIGEYAASSANGIRRYRYAGYPLTYGNVTGAEVHNDGEIYAAAMWRLRELWLGSGRSSDELFNAFVDGMNYTPSTPAFEHMRNGMLQSISLTGGADATARCTLVWQAFAQYGIGVGASGTATSSTTVSIVPSTTARSDCS